MTDWLPEWPSDSESHLLPASQEKHARVLAGQGRSLAAPLGCCVGSHQGCLAVHCFHLSWWGIWGQHHWELGNEQRQPLAGLCVTSSGKDHPPGAVGLVPTAQAWEALSSQLVVRHSSKQMPIRKHYCSWWDSTNMPKQIFSSTGTVHYMVLLSSGYHNLETQIPQQNTRQERRK